LDASYRVAFAGEIHLKGHEVALRVGGFAGWSAHAEFNVCAGLSRHQQHQAHAQERNSSTIPHCSALLYLVSMFGFPVRVRQTRHAVKLLHFTESSQQMPFPVNEFVSEFLDSCLY
jgi:hypothetical protein